MALVTKLEIVKRFNYKILRHGTKCGVKMLSITDEKKTWECGVKGLENRDIPGNHGKKGVYEGQITWEFG